MTLQFQVSEHLHRLAKRELDSGRAKSISEAEAILTNYKIHLHFPSEVASDPNHQAALLTAIALGSRVFLGGVSVSGDLDHPLSTPLPYGETFRAAITSLGGSIETASAHVPVIYIGGHAVDKADRFQIRTIFHGWQGGIVPAHSFFEVPTTPAMALSPMLSAALAINEAFLFLSGEMPSAGRRTTGLSLWNIDSRFDWLSPSVDEPCLRFLPNKLWIIGLGHLGQAYLWGLGLLPYVKPSDVELYLQDNDVVTPSTVSTSILSTKNHIGMKKTRVLAQWAEQRGFNTTLTELLLSDTQKRRSQEPAIALCGIDNAVGRRALDNVGFDFTVEAGLGRGHQDFRSILVHTLPSTEPSALLWRDQAADVNIDAPAYKRMLKDGSLDQCGVTLLAGKAVGAPFVGAVAAALALSEILRLLHGGKLNRLIDMNIVDLSNFQTAPQLNDFSSFNPGFCISNLP